MKWYAHASDGSLSTIVDALQELKAATHVVLETSPVRMRKRILQEEPGQVSAIIGDAAQNIASINLAAALVQDGRCQEVLLVSPTPTGSYRSRAMRAGITQLIDKEEIASAIQARHIRPLVQEQADNASQSLEAGVDLTDALKETDFSSEFLGDIEEVDGLTASPLRLQTEEVNVASEQQGVILCLASGRGGVGKTTLCAGFGQVAHAWNLRVAYVDLDLANGNLFEYYGLPEPADLATLGRTESLSTHDIEACGIDIYENMTLWGPCASPELSETVFPHIQELLSYCSQHFDVVIVDTPATWNDASAQALQSCDRLLLVSDDFSSSTSSLVRMAALAVRLGVARARIVRLSNNCDANKKEETLLLRAHVGLEAARSYRIFDGGIDIADLLDSGNAKELLSLGGDFAESLQLCLARTLDELGCLPDSKEAKRAKSLVVPRRARGLFGLKKRAAS